MPSESSSRSAKDALFASFARVGRALGNGHRVEIVDVLAQGERSVEALASEIGQSVANTSQHLRVLAGAGLTQSRREGNRVIYRLAGDDVAELWQALREVAARHLLEVEVLAAAYLGDRADVERLTSEELEARLAEGSVVVLDVRPAVEFEAGHIAGASSVPLHRLLGGDVEIAADTPVVAYCRGPYCVYADDAVRFLRARGVDASRLDVGYPEWLRAGRPVAVR
ncbi:MAG TPA: metalloregulator ArsR/SmtB family transcription factor [Gaiellaceae bacterium]|nr:metalloregulator ArsR/SmtB family transcription factor [Gaiellaceae bacterium]